MLSFEKLYYCFTTQQNFLTWGGGCWYSKHAMLLALKLKVGILFHYLFICDTNVVNSIIGIADRKSTHWAYILAINQITFRLHCWLNNTVRNKKSQSQDVNELKKKIYDQTKYRFQEKYKIQTIGTHRDL